MDTFCCSDYEKNKVSCFVEQTHVLLSPTLQSFHWQVNIIPSVDGIHALVHVIINNLTQANLVSHVAHFCGVVAIVATQGKEGLYCNHYPPNMFLLLAIKAFGCFHQQFDKFSINMLTWHGQKKALEAFLYQFCVPFINRERLWLYRDCKLPPS